METVDKTIRTETDLRQLVNVQIGTEEFGIDISLVHDIHRMVKITPIPQTPPHFKGIINLRGQIIPVVDFRILFNLPDTEDENKERRIVVIESNNQTIGFIVDGVREVLRIPISTIKEAPDIIKSQVDKRYLEGVAQLDDRLIIVLNIEAVFSIL